MAAQDKTFDLVVDTCGKFCPVPILEVARAIQEVQPGQTVLILATDPGVESDMAAWCRATRHELVSLTREGKVYRVLVRRAP